MKSMLNLDRVTVEKRAVAAPGPVSFSIPFPPSVNNLFATGSSGRFRTSRYNSWRDAAGNMLNASRVRRVPGPVALRIVLQEPPRRCDLDNFAKATIDLLVWMNIIDADDRATVRKIELEWGDVQGARVTITSVQHGVRVA